MLNWRNFSHFAKFHFIKMTLFSQFKVKLYILGFNSKISEIIIDVFEIVFREDFKNDKFNILLE
jgi:hypothetical protein